MMCVCVILCNINKEMPILCGTRGANKAPVVAAHCIPAVPSASSRYSELCDRKRAIALSEILIFAGFRKFFEK